MSEKMRCPACGMLDGDHAYRCAHVPTEPTPPASQESADRKANVQGYCAGIPWSMHLRAWDTYAKRYGSRQSAERIHERGGFHVEELDEFIPGWRDELSIIATLTAELAEARKEVADLKAARDVMASVATERNKLEQQRDSLRDEVASLRSDVERQREALDHYDKAMLAVFPAGTDGVVFHHWNEARKALSASGREVEK